MSSIAQLENASKKAKNTGERIIQNTIDIELWFDVEDREKAEEFLDMTIVNKIVFDENMFSVLPELTIDLQDDGAYYNIRPLKIGRKIYCKIQSAARTADNKEVKPILTRMTIDSVTQRVNQSSSNSNILIHCIYDAQGFINKVPIYPQPGVVSLPPIPENSSDAVTKVCNAVGLTCASDLGDGMDYMNYVNGTLTAKKFVDKIVDHAWVGEDDAPLFYVDLEGVAHFTSINKLLENKNTINAFGLVMYNRMYERMDRKDFIDYINSNSKLVYQDLKQVNLGAKINNVGGGITKSSFYDPLLVNGPKLMLQSSKVSTPDIDNTGISEKPDTNYLAYEGSSTYLFLGDASNREAAECNKLNGVRQGGIMSTNNHDYYEIAGPNNYATKMGFFQEFWKFTFDVNKQPPYFYKNASLMPRIGRVMYIDFSNEDFENKVYTGKYMVTRVQHIWTQGNSYAIAITCVSDGYYTGQHGCKYYKKCTNKANCAFQKDFNKCPLYKAYDKK